MDATELDLRLRVAQAAVRDTGKVAADHFARRAALTIDRKGVQDLVSEADRQCEELIVAALSRAFPGDGFLGEEGGRRNPGAAATWVIDPIDGTRNFLAGVPLWCISVALVAGSDSLLGLIYHPASDELFSAARGAGAFLNGSPIRVSGASLLTEARLGLGFSFRLPPADHARALEAVLEAECDYCRLGSGALTLAYVAAGRLDAFWHRHTNSWDVAAGLCLVREAGGWTSEFLAGDGLDAGGELLAATPALVEPLARLTGFAARAS